MEVVYGSLSRGGDFQRSTSAVPNRAARSCQQTSTAQGQPGNLEEAISEATRVEYALNFDAQTRPTSSDVNVVCKQETLPSTK